MDHRVEVDYVGFANRQRFTCYTCGVTLLRQPYMGFEDWKERVRDFHEKHPQKTETEKVSG